MIPTNFERKFDKVIWQEMFTVHKHSFEKNTFEVLRSIYQALAAAASYLFSNVPQRPKPLY